MKEIVPHAASLYQSENHGHNRRIEKAVDESRRSYIRSLSAATVVVAGAVAGAYYGPKMPKVKADTTSKYQGIEVGLLHVPVNFDGRVSEGEYSSDAKDYNFHWVQIFEPQTITEGHLYVKYSDFVYLGIDIPIAGSNLPRGSNLNLVVDTNNTGITEGENAEGVYNLYLNNESAKAIPTEVKDEKYGTGTPFSKELGGQFTKGKDYNWAYRFEPSPLNGNDHPQYEIKISTDILTRYSNEIGIDIAWVNDKGYLEMPQGKFWEKMRFTEQVIPESQSPGKLLTYAIPVAAGTGLAIQRSKEKITRREMLTGKCKVAC